jgi:hypothetical protein
MRLLKHGVRLVLGLYIAGCTLLVTVYLLGGAAIISIWWLGSIREQENTALIAYQVHRALEIELAKVPKQFSVADIDRGNWSLICLAGKGTPGTKIAAAIEARAINFNGNEIRHADPQKSKSTVVIVQKDGHVRQFWPVALSRLIAGGETVCVTPDAPLFTLPTEAAVRYLK